MVDRSVRLSEDDCKALSMIADKEGLSVSRLIRMAVSRLINDYRTTGIVLKADNDVE